MNRFAVAGALTAAAALAVPAAAAAHGSVYTDTARVLATPGDPSSITDQTRHVITNHGFTMVLRESNGLAANGMFDYSRLPSGYRDTLTWAQLEAEGASGAQPHATCRTPALETEAAIRAWQDEDPFYDYVPFQRQAAGLEDDPARWIPVVKTLTGVDLATEADPAAACAALPGATYVPADLVQTSAASLSSGTVEAETEPLRAQIDTLTTALTGETNAKNALQGLLDAARAELASLATPVKATLASARLKGRALAGKGARVTLTGPAGAKVSVKLAIAEGRARKLKLPSSVLASRRATFAADGRATVTLKAGKRARKALRNLDAPLAMRVTARSGDRIATASGTLTPGAGASVASVPAFAAHTEVKSTSPARGATRSRSLGAVTVTFTQAIQRGTLKVTAPDGSKVSKGSGGRDPRKVSRLRVGLEGGLSAGRYKAKWSIRAVDGHEQSGTFGFKLR